MEEINIENSTQFLYKNIKSHILMKEDGENWEKELQTASHLSQRAVIYCTKFDDSPSKRKKQLFST